jgi:putative ABC transport system permease protein
VSFLRPLARGLRALTRRADARRDVEDEVRDWLERAAEAHRARGLPPDEALRAAQIELGGVASVTEQIHAAGWENALEATWADARFALRRLRAEPGFTGVAVLTLALGVGAAAAIFGAVKPILLERLPYPDPERVAALWEVAYDGSPAEGTFGMARAISERTRTFEAVAAFRRWLPTLAGREAERLEGQRVSAAWFAVMGVQPALGRGFLPSEDRAGGGDVTVLADRLWRRRFGADPAIVGRQVTLNGTAWTVVGVMPPGFENVLAPGAEVWAPLQYDLSEGRAWGHHLRLVGRLREGATLEAARRELDGIGRDVLAEVRPETYPDHVEFLTTSLQEDVTRGVRPALLAVSGAVVLLLLLACVNVASLLLARGVRRRTEFALRSALGSGRWRLVRQVVTESLVLAFVGGAAGLGLAAFAVDTVVALAPPDLPRAGAIGIDAGVFVFGFALASVLGLAFGSAAALQAATGDVERVLRQGSPRTTGGNPRIRAALVVVQVALALVLLVGSGLLLRSVERLFAVDPGFDPSGLLTMQVQLAGPEYEEDVARLRFFSAALEDVRRVSGVTAAALTSQLPLSGDADLYGVHFDPAVPDDPGEVSGTFRYAVTPGYLEAMRIPLRRGRVLDERDDADAPLAVLVSESLARRRLAGRDPIGARLRIGDGPHYTVVGVAGDVKQESLALDADAVYVTPQQWRFADAAMSLVVRGHGDPAALAPAVRRAIRALDPDQAITRVRTMEDLVAASAAERRFVLTALEAFALAALTLAAAGIYAVVAGAVAERTRELGVRSALGSSPRELAARVVGQAMRLTVAGTAIGLAGAIAASRVVAAMLFGVSRLDPLTYAGAVGLLGAATLVACGFPAWRAARVDPARVLRTE